MCVCDGGGGGAARVAHIAELEGESGVCDRMDLYNRIAT